MGVHLIQEWTWTRGVKERPWAFTCDVQGCFWSTSWGTYWDADNERILHPCPTGGGTLEKGKSLLDEIWERLDELVDEIKEAQVNHELLSPEEIVRTQYEARGVASVIAILCNRHYADIDAVTREASRRYKIRKGLLDGPPSAHAIIPRGADADWQYTENRRNVQGALVRSWVPGATPAASPSARKFTEDEIGHIKDMKAAGLPTAAIARTFKSSEAEIRAV